MRKIDPTTRMVMVDGKQYAVTAKDVVFFEELAKKYRGIELAVSNDR